MKRSKVNQNEPLHSAMPRLQHLSALSSARMRNMTIRMFPGTKNRSEGTFGCSPVPETGTRVHADVPQHQKTATRVHSPKPPFYETALLFSLDALKIARAQTPRIVASTAISVKRQVETSNKKKERQQQTALPNSSISSLMHEDKNSTQHQEDDMELHSRV